MAILIRAAAAAIAVGAAAACVRDPSPIVPEEPSVAVHALLEAGDREAVVLLTRFPAGATEPVPVTGATGYVGRGSDSVALAPADAGSACRLGPGSDSADGCYRAPLPAPAAPGDGWWLRVHFPTGETARGQVRVPLPPEIRRPAADGIRLRFEPRGSGGQTSVLDAPLEWAWTDPGARLVQAFGPPTGFTKGAVLYAECYAAARIEHAPAGTAPEVGVAHARLLVHGAACQAAGGTVAWDSIHLPLLWVATDTAAARYLAATYAGTGIRPQRAAAGVRGAFGVFGAATIVERTVTLLPEPEG